MRKVYEILELPKPTKGDVGVEIEVEGASIQTHVSEVWRYEDDGSLRGAFPHGRCEFIFQKPILVGEVQAAIEELAAVQKKGKAKLNFSFRTSVHVHVNVQELTYNEVCNMIYIYLLLEVPLMEFCGEERIGNRFCLRLADAEGFMESLRDSFAKPNVGFHKIPRDSIRYASINLEAIPKYGSLEFRGMRGNMDPAIITPWCEMLVSIRKFAQKFADVEEVAELFKVTDNSKFLKMAVGKHAKLLKADFGEDMDRSYSLSLDLPFIVRDVKKNPPVEEPIVIKRPKPPKVMPVPQPFVRPEDMPPVPDPLPGEGFDEWDARRKMALARWEADKRLNQLINDMQGAPQVVDWQAMGNLVPKFRVPAPQRVMPMKVVDGAAVIIDELEDL